jgi:hypothetical protein
MGGIRAFSYAIGDWYPWDIFCWIVMMVLGMAFTTGIIL